MYQQANNLFDQFGGGQMPPQQNQFQTGFAGGGGNPFAFAGGAPGRQENVPSFLKEKADQNKD